MSDQERFLQLWPKLTHNQRRFVMALADHPTKKAAAESVGLSPFTVYAWGGEVDEVIELLGGDLMSGAVDTLRSVAKKAAVVKAEALDLSDNRLKQQAATEILDRVLGKPRAGARDAEAEEDKEIIIRYESPYE
jgi:hypothetical protein